MKNVKITSATSLLLLLITLLIMASCSEDDVIPDVDDPIAQGQDNPDPDPDPDPTGTENPDPNKVSESLTFKNAITHTGSIPLTNSSDVLKINRETIALVEGLQPFIGISKKDGSVLQTSTTYVQVVGSSTYVEAEFEEVVNDTLVYLNIEFDTTDWEFPVSFNIDIVPVDDNGTPIDIISIPVIVDKVAPNSGGCTIEEFLNGKDSQTYKWYVTYDNSGSPARRLYGEEISYSQVVNGCCTSSGGYYGNCIGFPTHSMVTGVTKTVKGGASITFHKDGSVTGAAWNILTQNLDPSNFDFCNGIPAHDISSIENTYLGTYTFNSANCSITIDILEDNDPDIWYIHSGVGSGVTYSKWGSHFLEEEHKNPETGEEGSYIQYYYKSD